MHDILQFQYICSTRQLKVHNEAISGCPIVFDQILSLLTISCFSSFSRIFLLFFMTIYRPRPFTVQHHLQSNTIYSPTRTPYDLRPFPPFIVFRSTGGGFQWWKGILSAFQSMLKRTRKSGSPITIDGGSVLVCLEILALP